VRRNVNLNVSVVEQKEKPVDALGRLVRGSSRVRMATAFLKTSGWGLVKDDIAALLARQGSLEVIFGLDFRLTEPKAVQALMELSSGCPSVTFFAFSDSLSDDVPTFHPKLYIGDSGDGLASAMVGSSNLTRGGMESNLEANLLIEGRTAESPIADLVSLYDRFRNRDSVFVPDPEYLALYAEVFQRVRKRGREALRESQTEAHLVTLRRREELLPGTVPTQRGLVVQAIRDIAGSASWAHWKDIAAWVETRARELGLDFKWDTLGNSVRGRLNEDTLGKGGDGLFERQGGVSGRHGKYRLSEAGQQYRGRPVRAS
jgi:HKD family nuclease